MKSNGYLRLTKAAEQSGVMVALYPSREVAERIAQPGGQPADEIHITLAYLGNAEGIGDLEELRGIVRGFASATVPLAGEIAGTGKFTEGDGVDVVTYASPDVPGLSAVRERLIEVLTDAGYPSPSVHGFIPHMTLADFAIDPEIPNLDLTFDELTLAVAGERYTFPLSGLRKGAAKADFEATWNDGHREVTVPIWKDDAKRIVYGVVMQPGVRDSQGDVVCCEEIEQAAHRFLAESRKHDVQHAEEQVDVVPVESFIAPMDMPFAGRPVLKGSWVMAVHVPDEEIWQQVVKDELTGFSIGGTAERAEE